MSGSQYKPGDKVVDITEGIVGEVIDGEPLDPFPGLEMDLIPVLWEHGHVVYTDSSYLARA
jgi:hypothetical protein